MRYGLRIIVIGGITVTSIVGLLYCNHRYYRYGYPFVTTASGFSYKCMTMGNGRKVKEGEWMSLDFTIKVTDSKLVQNKQDGKKTEAERVLFPSDDRSSEPFLFIFDKTTQDQHKQIADMVTLVEEKQRVVFKCSPQYFLGKETGASSYILQSFGLAKDDHLVIDLTVNKIMSADEKIAFDKIQHEVVLNEKKKQLVFDKQCIAEYLRTHNLQATLTDSGIAYIIDEPSQDLPVTKDKTVKLHYTGWVLNGKVFDTTKEEVAKIHSVYNRAKLYEAFACKLGNGQFFPGWEEGLLLLKKNEKARLFIPSTLAYGKQRSDTIPANSILLFELEILDVY